MMDMEIIIEAETFQHILKKDVKLSKDKKGTMTLSKLNQFIHFDHLTF